MSLAQSLPGGGDVAARAAFTKARIGVCVAFISLGIGYATFAVRLPAIKDRLGLDTGTLGLVLAAPAVGSLLALLLLGGLIERFGSRLTTRLAGIVFLLALPLLGLVANPVLLACVLAVSGAAGASLDSSMNVQAVALERSVGRPLLAGFHFWYSFGGLIGALVGIGAAAASASPRLHFSIVAGMLLAVFAVATAWLLEEREGGGGRLLAFRIPPLAFLPLAAIAFVCLIGEGVGETWSSVYMKTRVGAGATTYGAALAAFTLMMSVTRLVGDRLTVRFGRLQLLFASTTIAAAGFALAALVPSVPVVAVGFALVGTGLSLVFPLAVSTAAE
ncbi:MAG: MFS transporter, partial [Gaiellaceae bacterium]